MPAEGSTGIVGKNGWYKISGDLHLTADYAEKPYCIDEANKLE